MNPSTNEPPHESSKEPRFHWSSFVLGVLLIGLIGGLLFIFYRRPEPPPIVLHPPPTPAPTATALPTGTPAPIVVFVSGAVMQPGLYSLPQDARVGDALRMAGGFAENAAGHQLNQAERLWDGAQVHVRHQTEVEPIAPPAGLSGNALPTPTPESRALTTGNTGSTAGRINLNTATQSELEALPSIGATRAEAIIANRPYTRIEEITRVPGIGDGIFAQLRELVTVE
jgi:competence protein ComEA